MNQNEIMLQSIEDFIKKLKKSGQNMEVFAKALGRYSDKLESDGIQDKENEAYDEAA